MYGYKKCESCQVTFVRDSALCDECAEHNDTTIQLRKKIKQLEHQLEAAKVKNNDLWSDINRLQEERNKYKKRWESVAADRDAIILTLTPEQRTELYGGSVCFAVETKGKS